MKNIQPLTDAELEVLEFARESFRTPGHKEAAILERFGHSTTRYYQRLAAVLANPAAEAYDAMLVRRLNAQRARRAGARSGKDVVL